MIGFVILVTIFCLGFFMGYIIGYSEGWDDYSLGGSK
jgi:ABC-type dipeptide/oligopeptide/nickel transport system permease subunit